MVAKTAGTQGPLGDLGPVQVLVDGVDLGPTLDNVRHTHEATQAPVKEDQNGDDSVDDILIGQPTMLNIPFTRLQVSVLASIMPGAAGSGTTGNSVTVRSATGQSAYANAKNVKFVRIVDGIASTDADDVAHFFKVYFRPNYDLPYNVGDQRVFMQECRVYKVHAGEVHAGDIFRWGDGSS